MASIERASLGAGDVPSREVGKAAVGDGHEVAANGPIVRPEHDAHRRGFQGARPV